MIRDILPSPRTAASFPTQGRVFPDAATAVYPSGRDSVLTRRADEPWGRFEYARKGMGA